ncbi:TetR family transcriptional regulator, partial [Acinetobacter baumannii]
MSAKEKAGDRRRDNAAATRAALLAAGRRQFGAVGYEAASVAELCAEAAVTTGALYYH